MTENIKYKAADLAKDLKEPLKDVLDVLGEKFPAKKGQTALTEEELNYVFEHYTKKNEVTSFAPYFAMAGQPKQEPKAEEKPAPKAEEKTAPAPKAEAKHQKCHKFFHILLFTVRFRGRFSAISIAIAISVFTVVATVFAIAALIVSSVSGALLCIISSENKAKNICLRRAE